MDKRVFIIHGWEGRPDNHWFPWLSWELKARGFEVFALTMPHADEPKVAEWVNEIKTIIGRPTKDTYIVAHSLGCVATLRYLEKLPANTKIGGAVFVAGFLSDINIPQIAEFYNSPLDVDKAKQHCNKFITIFSDNDRYVPMEKSLELQKALHAKAILERGRGHFTKGDGVTGLPSIFQSVMDLAVE